MWNHSDVDVVSGLGLQVPDHEDTEMARSVTLNQPTVRAPKALHNAPADGEVADGGSGYYDAGAVGSDAGGSGYYDAGAVGGGSNTGGSGAYESMDAVRQEGVCPPMPTPS